VPAVSVLHDIFIATDEEVAGMNVDTGIYPPLASPSREPIFPTVDAKGTGDIPLATLELLLGGDGIDDAGRVIDLLSDPIATDDLEEGPWLFRLNQRLVDRLADADGAQIAAIAGPWAATDEMYGWTDAQALALLGELAELCRRGRAESKGLFRWTSL